MDTESKNKVEYLVIFVSEFARKHSLTLRQAYNYLSRYKAVDFLDNQYDVAHTLRLEDVLDDMTTYCQRFGGAIK